MAYCVMTRSLVGGVRFLLLAAMVIGASAVRTASARQAPPPSAPRVIEITARRFAFEPSEVTVTAGESVRLLVHSADGPHGFEIRQLKVKKELARGAAPIAIDFTAGAPGQYPIMCSEYCGEGHPNMKGMLVVTAQEAP